MSYDSPLDELMTELLQHHFEVSHTNLLLRPNEDPIMYAETEEWLAHRHSLIEELVLSFSQLEMNADDPNVKRGIRQCLRYLVRFNEINGRVFTENMYINPSRPPRVPLEQGQVWAWIGDCDSPHWEIQGTGAIVE